MYVKWLRSTKTKCTFNKNSTVPLLSEFQPNDPDASIALVKCGPAQWKGKYISHLCLKVSLT